MSLVAPLFSVLRLFMRALVWAELLQLADRRFGSSSCCCTREYLVDTIGLAVASEFSLSSFASFALLYLLPHLFSDMA